MSRFCFSPIFLLCLIALALPASAQTAMQPAPAAKQPVPASDATRKEKSEAKAEADRVAKQRRAQARSLLISLASDARSFRDQKLRARSLARIADALWNVDGEQGRTLFRKAWEAAETADHNQGPYRVGEDPLNLRGEVLKLAARRDRLLAEEFLQKLKADQSETTAEHSQPDLWELPEALEQRLVLAKGLLGVGDVELALQFADPVLRSVTMSTVDFLTLLREKDPAAADRRYTAMLLSTGGNMLADANTISVLSSYIFTPHLYLIFNTQGIASSWVPTSFSPAIVDSHLQRVFFQSAAAVLLRPQPPPEQDRSTAGIAGEDMVVKRLLPLFEQYAPKEITEAMRGQLGALNALVGDDLLEGEDEWIQKGLGPEKSFADQEHSVLDQIEDADTSGVRDELYFRLALLALDHDDLKARVYVSKIEESEFRKRVQAWVDAGLVISAIKKKKIKTALELIHIGELTHIQRLWVLTQAAKLLAKTDRDKALSLLDDATAEARRIDGVDLDRPRGLLAIANALKLIEPSRAWDAVFDAIKAANSTDGFTGEDGVLYLQVNSKTLNATKTESVPDFDIEGILGKLANDDYDRAVQVARGLQGEAPRAGATIAIARAVLAQKAAASTGEEVAKPTN